jgi:hypothetical protein
MALHFPDGNFSKIAVLRVCLYNTSWPLFLRRRLKMESTMAL